MVSFVSLYGIHRLLRQGGPVTRYALLLLAIAFGFWSFTPVCADASVGSPLPHEGMHDAGRGTAPHHCPDPCLSNVDAAVTNSIPTLPAYAGGVIAIVAASILFMLLAPLSSVRVRLSAFHSPPRDRYRYLRIGRLLI